ncbi:urease accessory protein UreD [Thalassobacillus devorans]|uniref:urease accessory protein UreD n=1 Tax=Thalassobacillus devorans TaxID=279813 RepID=UPI00048AE6EC|nr:urease accessory protein UreD [Thalassobacillus devorans]
MNTWTGNLQLKIENKKGKSIPKDIYFQGAFKLMRPKYFDDSGQPCYFILNPGGGYLDGDRYRMDLNLEEKAELLLTTQAATKVYKTPNQSVIQETNISMGKDSTLEYVPDPIIAYRSADYIQHNNIHMESGATLIYSDILTPGWSPDGSLFSYDNIQVKNQIFMNGRRVVFDHLRLKPNSQDIGGIGLMEGFTHVGSMIVICDQVSKEFMERIKEHYSEDDQKYKMGISSLVIPGFSVRILSHDTQTIEEVFNYIHQTIRKELLQKDVVFLRKY